MRFFICVLFSVLGSSFAYSSSVQNQTIGSEALYQYVTINISNHQSTATQAAFAMETTKFIGPFWPYLALRFEAGENKVVRADNPNGRLQYRLGNNEHFSSITFSGEQGSCTVHLNGCAQYMKFWCGGFFTESSDSQHCSIRPTALNVFAVDVM